MTKLPPQISTTSYIPQMCVTWIDNNILYCRISRCILYYTVVDKRLAKKFGEFYQIASLFTKHFAIQLLASVISI